MKIFIIGTIMLTLAAQGTVFPEERFDIYTDSTAPSNNYSPSGWMGDFRDMKFSANSTENPYSGKTCIKIIYTGKRSYGKGWAGIYWQSSPNNWGKRQTGFDLKGMNKLTFMARGNEGEEIVSLVKVGGIQYTQMMDKVKFPDTVNVSYGPMRLTKEWQKYEINLAGKDLSYINGGFCIVFNAYQAGREQTIYLDNIYYSYDPYLKEEKVKITFPFYVYADASSLDNHFIPSGWMPATAAEDLKAHIACEEEPFSGNSCIKIKYENNSGTRWAGIYWQNPANNWGIIPNAGVDLRGAKKLTFHARGAKGGEIINEFKVGGIASGPHTDSDSVSIGPVKLTKKWQKYEIDLRGSDLSYIIGGFCWATNIDVNNPKGIIFYLDEIHYENK